MAKFTVFKNYLVPVSEPDLCELQAILLNLKMTGTYSAPAALERLLWAARDHALEETDPEVLRMLSEAHREPVLPMSRFCSAISTWFRVIERLNAAVTPEESWRGTQGKNYHSVLFQIERDIRKSNLLARLLYGGQKLRTQACPIHKGKYNGEGDCSEGCEGTGWLPEP